MKSLISNKRFIICALMALVMVLSAVVPAFAEAADDSNAKQMVDEIVELINKILGYVLTVVGALGAVYCVFLGIKFIKAEEPQDREKAKSHLKNAIIGFVLIFILMLALKLLMPDLIDWVKNTKPNN